MPRIPDEFLESVVYLYPSVLDANEGKRVGGSGFIVGVRSGADPDQRFLYVVTCRHVVEEGMSRTIRINTVDGKSDVINYSLADWRMHPDGHDVAVCPIPVYPHHKLGGVPDEYFITEQSVAEWNIGPGDNVFVMGRFINHEGKQKNTPALRFGNIAMSPDEPIRQENGHLQLSFLIETHSSGGYSGSPVVVFIPPADRPFRKISQRYGAGLWLLGVDWGHIPQWQPVVRRTNPKEKYDDWGIRNNTLMAGVVPAWQLRELLDIKEFTDMRKEIDNQTKAAQTDPSESHSSNRAV